MNATDWHNLQAHLREFAFLKQRYGITWKREEYKNYATGRQDTRTTMVCGVKFGTQSEYGRSAQQTYLHELRDTIRASRADRDAMDHRNELRRWQDSTIDLISRELEKSGESGKRQWRRRANVKLRNGLYFIVDKTVRVRFDRTLSGLWDRGFSSAKGMLICSAKAAHCLDDVETFQVDVAKHTRSGWEPGEPMFLSICGDHHSLSGTAAGSARSAKSSFLAEIEENLP